MPRANIERKYKLRIFRKIAQNSIHLNGKIVFLSALKVYCVVKINFAKTTKRLEVSLVTDGWRHRNVINTLIKFQLTDYFISHFTIQMPFVISLRRHSSVTHLPSITTRHLICSSCYDLCNSVVKAKT